MKKIILIILIIFLLPSALAFEIFPNTINLENEVGKLTNFSLNIKNDNNFTMYNISFEANTYFSAPKIDKLDPQESKTIEASVLTSTPITTTLQIKLQGIFLTPVSETPLTHQISILATKYEPTILTIRDGDSVTWTNSANITHTVTKDDFSFDHSLAPSQQVTKTFNNLEVVNYYDRTLLFGGQVIVQNNTFELPTHNDIYDSILNINLVSNYQEASIDFEVLDGSNMNLSYNQNSEGLLKIINTGNETARTITLSSENSWVSFSENSFDLAPSGINFVTFLVSPSITQTNSTNVSYFIPIKADGVNTASIIKNIEVFINYAQLSDANLTDEQARIERIRQLKEELQELINSLGLNESVEPQIIYRDPEISLNLTQRRFQTFLEDQRLLRDEFERLKDPLLANQEYTANQLPNVVNNISDRLGNIENQVVETKKSTDKRSIVEGIIFFTIIITSLVVYLSQNYKKKKREEGKFLE